MADYFVDASRPDDSGDGQTPETAKKTCRAAYLIAPQGSRILLKAGYCYDHLTGRHFYMDGTSNLEIGAYGTASDLPLLDALTYENPGATGWTHVSGGIWKKVFGAFWVRRLFVGSTNNGILISQRTVGTAMRRATGTGLTGGSPNPAEATIIAALNANNIWFGGGSTTSYALYVYTGSTVINPPDYYSGIAFIQADGTNVGSVTPIYVENRTGIHVHDIKIRGAGTAAIQLFARNSNVRDVSDCLFENIEVSHPWLGAFASRIGYVLSPLWRIRNCIADNIYCDYGTSTSESELDMTYNYLSDVADGFDIGEGSVGVGVRNCTAINQMHVGLAAHTKGMRTAPPEGCWMINNTVTAEDWHTYARGINAVDGNTLFQGNYIDGQNIRSQISGSCKVIGNVWTNMRQSTRRSNASQWISVESYMFAGYGSGIGNERYLRINPVDVVIANNTAVAPIGEALNFAFYDSTGKGEADNSFNADTIKVQNNNVPLNASGLFLTTYEDSGKVVGQQIITHNGAYNTLTGDNKITWRGANYAINAAPGCSSNIETDSLRDAQHRPAAEGYIRTGTYLGGKDFYGKPFYDPPNIGAVDDLTDTPKYVLKRA